MTDFLISVVSVAIVLGVMILVHEWGHFIVAKSFGVRVEIFSIGFGPRLWGRKRGDTDYRISALPLGGYVKMAGDNPAEERTGAEYEFQSKPRWQRVIIALAGPAMNLLMAVLLVTGLYMRGKPQRLFEAQPMEVVAVLKDSPAEKAGIRPGDRVVEFAGVDNPTWERASLAFLLSSMESPISVVVERQGPEASRQVPLSIPTEAVRDPGDIYSLVGFPSDPVVVGRLATGGPGERSGLRVGDRIVAVNGQQPVSPEYLRFLIQQNADKPLEMVVERGDAQLKLNLRPQMGDRGDGERAWLIGLNFEFAWVERAYGPVEALQHSVWFNARLTRGIFSLLGRLVTGGASLKKLGGPVEIARQSGQAAKQGALALIQLMAILSLNLGILNLLPIPILDGGHVLVLSIEGLIRRDLSLAMKERIVQVGFVFLVVVFGFVMYNDVLRLLPHR